LLRLSCLSIVLICTLAAAAGLSHLAVRDASACSADEEWDPIAESDVIAGGRIAGWTPAPLAGDARGMFVPVVLDLRVEHVWKGAVGAPIVDETSLTAQPVAWDGETVTAVRWAWAGSAGACGALNADPTGMYAVLGLHRQPDGRLRTNLLTTFYIDPRPYDPAGVRGLSERIGLPATGHGRAGGGDATALAALAALAAATGTGMVLAGVGYARAARVLVRCR